MQSSPGAGLIDESQLEQLDTNGDGGVSAIDALVIINFLSSHDGTQGEGETPAQLDDVQQVYDSIRDGKVSVIDALQVINYLSRSNATASSESVAVSAEVAMPLLDAVNSPPEDGLDEDLIRLLADDQSRVDLYEAILRRMTSTRRMYQRWSIPERGCPDTRSNSWFLVDNYVP